MNTKRILLAGVIALCLISCSVSLPVTATSNPIGSKVGSAKAVALFHIIWIKNDASIQTAAKTGGITRISTVDVVKRRGLFSSSIKTVVTGE